MKLFRQRDIAAALAHAKAGGFALHLHRILNRRTAPRCFVVAIDRGEDIAHLFCTHAGRLAETAKRLGVRAIRIERAGTDRMHIDLCGAPLKRAVALCEGESA